MEQEPALLGAPSRLRKGFEGLAGTAGVPAARRALFECADMPSAACSSRARNGPAVTKHSLMLSAGRVPGDMSPQVGYFFNLLLPYT